ncbi:MAG: GNAT family N-acetyltransferase [Paracoccaceae bacterium]|nr:GNAT family N-acetyltransferase [Paracoccaceae bacterium]
MTDFTARDFREISEGKLEVLTKLKVSEKQQDLGGSFAASVAEWKDAHPDDILGVCFFQAERPVGLVLLKRPPLSPPWVPLPAISLHGLKIAQTDQGKGLGKRAFGLSVAFAKNNWPEATTLTLAVDAGNDPALAVYRGFGMSDSGPVFQGRIGLEHRLELKLRS